MRWTEEDLARHEGKDKLQAVIEKHGFVPHEDVEQVCLVRWLDMKRICFFHPANGGKRNVITAKKLKAQGVKAGVGDIVIIDRPPGFPDKVGVVIELKRQKGGVVSAAQKEWLDKFRDRGWFAEVCCGAESAIDYLKSKGF